MKNKIITTMLPLLVAVYMLRPVEAVYFRAFPNREQCFKDMISTNYTLEMEVSIVDEVPLFAVRDANLDARSQGRVQKEGVLIRLMDPEAKELFTGEVHPNVQYEFEAEKGGQYTLCVQLTDAAFSEEYPKVRTQVKFSSEFHRNRRLKKEQKSIFDSSDINLIDDENASGAGNFHKREAAEKQYEMAATEGSFAPIFRRVEKLNDLLTDIENYQNFERQQEELYKDFHTTMYDSFYNMNWFEIAVVSFSAAYSVWSLRKFFVKKHIY